MQTIQTMLNQQRLSRWLGVLTLGLFLSVMHGSALAAAEPANMKNDAAAKANKIGTVVAIRGGVTATDGDGKTRTLAIKQPVFRLDVLKTNKRGRVQIIFKDRTIVSLGRKSEMKLAVYAYDKLASTGKMTTEVKEGAFRIMGGAITKVSPGNFKTVTPSATIGVRGSFFAGQIMAGVLKAVFLGGKGITVTNNQGQQVTVTITRHGFGTTVTGAGTPPNNPGAFTPTEMDALSGGFGPHDGMNDPFPPGQGDPNAGGIGDAGNIGGTGDAVPGGTGGPTGPLGGGGAPFGAAGMFGDPTMGNLADTIALTTATFQANLIQTTQSTAGVFATGITSGRYFGSLNGVFESQAGALNWYGAMIDTFLGTTAQGPLATGASGQGNFSFALTGTNPDYVSFSSQHTLVLDGLNVVVPVTVVTDTKSEFLYYTNVVPTLVNSAPYIFDFNELGFIGKESLGTQTGGIAYYHGDSLAGYREAASNSVNSYHADFNAAVNFRTRKIIGVMGNPTVAGATSPLGSAVAFYGDVLADGTIANVRATGSIDRQGGFADTIVAGTQDLAHLYGSSAQGLGISLIGSTYTEIGQTPTGGTFNAVAAGIRESAKNQAVAPTGASSWRGYAVGLNERIAGTGGEAYSTVQDITADGNLALTVDRNTGSVAGTMSLTHSSPTSPPGLHINSLQIGGAQGSAYVSDNFFVGELGGPTGVIEKDNGSSAFGTVNPQFSIFYTTPQMNAQWSTFVTWGYWETSYDDPMFAGSSYDIEGLWVAGSPTPTSVIANMIATSLTATYNGGAALQIFTPFGNGTVQELGTSSLAFNFGNTSFSGNLTFPSHTFTFSGGPGSVTSQYFTTSTIAVTNAFGLVDQSLRGRFFGPGGEAVGGSLSGTESSTPNRQFQAVFGANR